MKSKLTQTVCGYIFLEGTMHSVPKNRPKILFLRIFQKIKTWQKCVSKWFPIKFITAWLLQTETLFKASIKYWSNVTQALFWEQESRINSVRTMKKKAKTIDGLHWPFDTKWRYLHMFLCKMTTLLRVTFQACKSSTVPQQHHTLESLTVWQFSLVVRCRTHRKKRPFQKKSPKI